MAIGSIACSCCGENPNCFRCDGTGFYNLDDLIKEYVPFIEPRAQSSKLASSLEHHRLSVTNQTIPKTRTLKTKANRVLQKTKFQRRPGELTAREKILNSPFNKDLASNNETIVRGAVLKLSGYHTKSQELTSNTPNKHSVANVTENSKIINRQELLAASSSNEYQARDVLDASRQFASFARENGRFGSMPSFDGMDDESFS